MPENSNTPGSKTERRTGPPTRRITDRGREPERRDLGRVDRRSAEGGAPRLPEIRPQSRKELENETRRIHERHNGNPLFRGLFYEETARMRNRLFSIRYPERNPEDLSFEENEQLTLDAEIFATPVADAEMRAIEADIDPLTGIHNRRGIKKELERMHEHARRHEDPLTIVFVDADRFKQVNDTLDHSIGDAVIRTLARTIQDNIRIEDSVGRYGGDEFLMGMFADPEETRHILNRIREQVPNRLAATLREEGVAEEQIEHLSLTASFGFADASTVEDVAVAINKADTALVTKERFGRNVVIGPEELQQLADDGIDTTELSLKAITKHERTDEEPVPPPTRWENSNKNGNGTQEEPPPSPQE